MSAVQESIASVLRPKASTLSKNFVKVRLEQGITFIRNDQNQDDLPIEVNFGMHIQDILSLLGNPSKQHAGKHLNKLYFLNYLQLGVDFAFSVEDHRLNQIVLHTN